MVRLLVSTAVVLLLSGCISLPKLPEPPATSPRVYRVPDRKTGQKLIDAALGKVKAKKTVVSGDGGRAIILVETTEEGHKRVDAVLEQFGELEGAVETRAED